MVGQFADDHPLNPLSPRNPGREHFISGGQLWDWWQQAKQQAIGAEVPIPELDWLLQELTLLDRLSLRLGTFQQADQIPLKLPFPELVKLWQRRVQERVPIQYLIGSVPWRHFQLQVSPAVLIPRPETELLIDLVAAAIEKPQPRLNIPSPLSSDLHQEHWADLGTGSGAIAIGLATAFPRAMIHATDCSPAALEVASANAVACGVDDRIQFYTGFWLEPLTHLKGQFSGIVSNPPYIPSALIPCLQPEVTRHEPHLALDGGLDGLDAIRHLVNTAPAFLRPGGIWAIEMMAGQAPAVTDLLAAQGSYRDVQILPDLAGIDRFALAYRCDR